MNDQELIELAAKAAGDTITGRDGGRPMCSEPCIKIWNPLYDDGDALRLAVKLGLAINIAQSKVYAGNGRMNGIYEVMDTSDPYATTRRAIVRAAAEIGATHLDRESTG